jgi:G3E family GTPase
MNSKQLPLTVIGGYLGAGKTTLVNHLLTQAAGLRCAVLVNDFGEINIDSSLIACHDGDTISLQNGCLCCSMADGFAVALSKIVNNPASLDHIVVEASGVAQPGKIAQTAQAFRLPIDGVVVVVDAEQVREQAANKYVGETVLRQLAQADMLIVNKMDLISPEQLSTLRGWLEENAPAVPTYHAVQSQIPLEVLLGHVEHRSGSVSSEQRPGHGHRTWVLKRNEPVTRAAISRLADRLGKRVFRAKGFVRLADDPGRTFLFQQVGKRWKLTEHSRPSAMDDAVQIVVIEPQRLSA